MWKQEKFPVEDASHVGEIRRNAVTIAKELEYDEELTGKIAIVVTELATNVYKHARRGEIILSYSRSSFDILAIDKGRGILNVTDSLRDGFSTAGTAGGGLGAIKRGAHYFELYTQENKGTIVYVNFRKVVVDHPELCIGGISLPIKGEEVCGDSWSYCRGEKIKVLVADGLGHGLLAHEASRLAVEVFEEESNKDPADVMGLLHRALRSSRGAAAAIAEIDQEKKILNYCGVGNIATSIVAPGSTKRCISYNGTLGVQVTKIHSLPYPLDKDAVVVMASDGISTQWDLKQYPGIMMKHPFIIASLLYRDYAKTTDDASVIVIRGEP